MVPGETPRLGPDEGLVAIVVDTRTPLREVLLDPDQPADPGTEALLMFAARLEHIEQVIKPALKRGTWVVSDRFSDASFAYQGGGRGVPVSKLEQLEYETQRAFE